MMFDVKFKLVFKQSENLYFYKKKKKKLKWKRKKQTLILDVDLTTVLK